MKRPPYIRPDLRATTIKDLRELVSCFGFVTAGVIEVATGHVRISVWPLKWETYTVPERVDMLHAQIRERKAIGISIDVETVPVPQGYADF